MINQQISQTLTTTLTLPSFATIETVDKGCHGFISTPCLDLVVFGPLGFTLPACKSTLEIISVILLLSHLLAKLVPLSLTLCLVKGAGWPQLIWLHIGKILRL